MKLLEVDGTFGNTVKANLGEQIQCTVLNI